MAWEWKKGESHRETETEKETDRQQLRDKERSKERWTLRGTCGLPWEETIDEMSWVNWGWGMGDGGRREEIQGWEHEGSGWVSWGQDGGEEWCKRYFDRGEN